MHLYEEHGDAFVDRLRGMFAFALWDARRRRLVLARDRFGIKPLYYAQVGRCAAVRLRAEGAPRVGLVAARPDLRALRQLLTFGRILSPRALVAGISKVPAGHLLAYSHGSVTLTRYWDAMFPASDDYEERSDQAWADGLREHLAESVGLHMRSDVPVGAWLSGGIDSSAVAALMAPLPAAPVKTFTMRIDDPANDELHGRRALSDFPAFRLEGHAVPCGVRDFDQFPLGVWHHEGQLLGSTSVGQLRVAQATAEHVKVVLCGEGADELLGGYSWYRTLHLLAPLFALPRDGAALHRRGAGHPAPLAGGGGHARRTEGDDLRALLAFDLPPRQPARGEPAPVARRRSKRFAREADDDFDVPTPSGFEHWHPFARMQYFDIKHRMGDGVVHGLDSTSMAHSVEARVPFLDHVVSDYCARIPPWVKMRRLREKAVLRRAMRKTLPDEIVRRPKWAMRVPVDEWLRGPLPDFVREELAPDRVREAGYFDAAGVAQALELHRAQREHLGGALCAVLGIQLWDRMFRRVRLDGQR